MYVDRCICGGVSFARIREAARVMGGDPRVFAQATGFGRGCGLCLSYVRESLRNGTDRIALTPIGSAAAANGARPGVRPAGQLPA